VAAIAAAQRAVMVLPDARPELAYEQLLADALVRLAVETDCDVATLRGTVTQLTGELGLDPVALALRALGDPRVLTLPLQPATDAVLALVQALAPVQKVSLWLRDPERGGHAPEPGADAPSENALAISRRALALEAAAEAGGLGIAPIDCWQRPFAALVYLPEDGEGPACSLLAERAASLLAPAFERASLIEGNLARSEALLSTTEKRLTRLAFDLHDGPLQDAAVLIGDLQQLRARLTQALGGTALGHELLAEVEDAAAVAEFLVGDLRDLASSIDGSGICRKRFDDLLAGLVRKFTTRCDAEVDLEILGDTADLTDSQKITLTRVIQEALSNVRDHSGATTVHLRVDARGSQVRACLIDDGRGFDVEPAMHRAGRAGSMGLAGMIERVRLLGGACEIWSRPGSGTRVSVTIARWQPPVAVADPEPGQLLRATG
jgi:signal transduction histidine kinase